MAGYCPGERLSTSLDVGECPAPPDELWLAAVAIDSVLSPDDMAPEDEGVHLTVTPEASRILVSGLLCERVIAALEVMLDTLPHDRSVPVLIRIVSTEVDFGVTDKLRHLLATRRLRGSHQLAVWAHEPLIRRGIPVALLHHTPPLVGGSWESAVPMLD